MSEIEVFQFPTTGQQIRAVLIDGEPWFALGDVAVLLRYRDAYNAGRLLDEDQKGTHPLSTLGGAQDVTVINESGLYVLILRSQRPEAKAFRRWVTAEVLPTIRKTGSYGTPAIPDMTTPEGRLQILDMAVQAERRALAAETRIKELEPDAARARKTMDAHGLSLVRNVAKRFGIREKALREFLYAEQLLIRTGASRNEPYARYVQSGHFEVKTSLIEIDPDRPPEAKSTTYVTPKGEALIWKRLHNAGYVTSPQMPAKQLALV